MTYGEELRAEGMQRGQVRLLEKLLVLEFGELPVEVRARIEAANAEQIDRYATRILTATTLDDVFGDPS